nr:MAG TPA: Protein of unknown function (DUF1492) [Caudoviricetes sp.]
MTTKEYLSRYRWQNDRINAKLEQAAELRRKVRTVASHSSGDTTGAGSSAIYDRVGEITARIVDMEHEIDDDIDRCIDIQREVLSVISSVPDERLRHLLELKYINCLTLEEIAVRMDYSYKQICRLHGQALLQVRCP